jgi:ElaB/YqjD/DUF883 family membrane-anchored ribosome-binding protein
MGTDRENLRKTVAVIIALLVLGLVFYLAAWRSPDANAQFASEVVALSVIGAIAVGIERILESFWAFWEWTGNARNPLGPLSNEYRHMLAELEENLQPLSDEAGKMMNKVTKLKEFTKAQAGGAKAELENVRTTLAELLPNIQDPKFEVMAAAAMKQITVLEQKYPDLEETARTAGMAVDSAVNFVDSFKENPGRRLLSIYLGAVLGLLLVWITGLDLFQASLGTNLVREGWAGAHLGVALTGLILGLGSSPTHEIIQILKEIKLSRKADNR